MDLAPIKQCRICGSDKLELILSLGEQYASDFISSPDEKREKGPLDVVLCRSCYLLQLRNSFPKDLLYRNYWYKSGVNQTMRNELGDIAMKAERLVKLDEGSVVTDIGSNDGTLLRQYKSRGIVKVGFEPSNLWELGKDEGTTIIHDYFNYEAFARQIKGRSKVMTSIAMFYDLENPNKFVEDVAKCLDEDGVWINELGYAPMVFKQNAFDYFCHEHLELYTMYSMENLLNRHGLDIFDVETNEINGGSFRLYIKHRDSAIKRPDGADERVKRLRDLEAGQGYRDVKIYKDFAGRVIRLRADIHRFIEEKVKQGKKVYAYGASTKGNTLLQSCNLDTRLITAAAERNPDKWGKYTVGTNIPIISEEQARNEHPDYFLVLPWAFINEFRKREEEFYRKGGRFIAPLPEVKIVE